MSIKQKLSQKVLSMSIKTKILVGYICILLLIAIPVNVFSYLFTYKLVINKTSTQAYETIFQLAENIDHNINLINEKISFIAYNSKLQEILSIEPIGLNDRNRELLQREVSKMTVIAYSSVSMYDLEIVSDSGEKYYVSSSDLKTYYKDSSDFFYTLSKEGNGRNVFYNDSKSNSVQVLKQIKHLTNLNSLGYIRVALKKELFNRMVRGVDFASDGSIIILDKGNEIVVGQELFDKEVADEILLDILEHNRTKIDGNNYIIVQSVSKTTGWKTIGLLPLSVIQKEARPVQIFVFILTVFIVLLSLLISKLVSKTIADPIHEVVVALEDFSAGNLDKQIEAERKDEIGKLQKQFNDMSKQISVLIEQNYNTQILLKESEFKALQAQINPHFLYNTLDTINWLARKESMETISKMVSAISNLMRISISNKKKFITLEEEIDYIRQYLFIQEVRYKNKLKTTIEIDNEILSQIIPKLILQPIIENAVVHGIEKSKHKGEVKVIGERIFDTVRFTISDTGVGMDKKTLGTILDDDTVSDQVDSHSHIGLRTVHQRLKYLYGEQQKMIIDSLSGKGTIVIIEIPYYEKPSSFK